MDRRQSLKLAAASALFPALALAQTAQPFPSRAVSIYVPYAPGGSIDASTRALAKAAEKSLGAPVVIVNRPGAGGSIAASTVARAVPDGYTLGVVAPSNLTITPQLQKVPYDPFTDFTPVSNFGSTTIYMVVRKDSPFASLEQFIEHARQKPGDVIMAITAIGAGTHLSTARLMQERGVTMDYVTFGGGAQIVTALMGGHVKVAVLAGEVLPSILSGDLRVLAAFSRDQLAALKSVRSIQQSGSTWEPDNWIGLAGPHGMPEDVRLRLEKAFLEATNDPTFLRILEDLAMVPKRMTGAELKAAIKKSYEDNGRLVRAVGLVK